MFQVFLFLGLALLVNSQTLLVAPRNNAELSSPTPYEFSYSSPAIGGGSSHQESGDEFGRKTGSYTVEDEDGRQRVVQYVADENGFRVSISTNEPGTSNQNPADVNIASSAEEGGIQELAAPAVVPIAPARTSQPRPFFRPQPQPFFRPQPQQFFRPQPQPFRRPVQPARLPFQPTLIPFQPALFPFGNQQPGIFPVSGFQDSLIPIQIDNGFQQPGLIPDNFLQFRPYGDVVLPQL